MPTRKPKTKTLEEFKETHYGKRGTPKRDKLEKGFEVFDPALNEYRDKVLFPEKLEQANKVLRTAKPPRNKNRR